MLSFRVHPLSKTLALSLILGSTLVAQTRDAAAGLGRRTLATDIETATGYAQILAVQVLAGDIYLAARDDSLGHSILVVDSSGTILRSFPQSPLAQATTWGFRDGATDGAVLAFGSEAGIEIIDPSGKPATQFNGQAIRNPITGAGLTALGIYRALAFDSLGDQGRGSFWTASFGSDLIEVDLQGAILTSYKNPPAPNNWSIYGLCFDPRTRTLWCNAAPDRGELAEIDPLLGTLTGVTIDREQLGSAQGGLCLVPGGLDGRKTGADLLAIDQGTPTWLSGYRLHLDSLIDGRSEPRLIAGVDLNSLTDRTPIPFDVQNQILTIDLDQPSRTGTLFFNVNGDALGRGTLAPSPLVGLRELAFIASFTTPMGVAAEVPLFSSAGSNPLRIPISIIASAPTIGFGPIRAQAIYLEPADPIFPLRFSNQVFWTYESLPQPEIEIEAYGTNSYNADTSSGYWRVVSRNQAPGAATITSVVFDYSASINPTTALLAFDIDQPGMLDRFDAGNGTVSGCTGTFRNASDQSCGLVYDAQNTAAGGCAPGANSGFLASNPSAGTGRYQTLEFRFTNGSFSNKTFEFDCDTDNGASHGGANDGLGITVRMSDGTIYGGVLVADPKDPLRASLTF